VLYSDTHIKYLMPAFLHDTRWASHGEFTWAFVLQPSGEQDTRLILRTRARFGPGQLRTLFVPLFYLGEAIIPRMTLRALKLAQSRAFDPYHKCCRLAGFNVESDLPGAIF